MTEPAVMVSEAVRKRAEELLAEAGRTVAEASETEWTQAIGIAAIETGADVSMIELEIDAAAHARVLERLAERGMPSGFTAAEYVAAYKEVTTHGR